MSFFNWIQPADARAALETGDGRGIKVALLDSGVELSHPHLAGLRLIDDISYVVDPDGIVQTSVGWGIDPVGHGTAVASVLLRIAPRAQIGSFRVLDQNNHSQFHVINEAAKTAIEKGYQVINCSFGGSARWDSLKFFKPWLDLAYRSGVHVISACSNLNFRSPEWPGNFPTVISVNMARTQSDELFVRWDDDMNHLVEFAARGVEIETAWKDSEMRRVTGSSYAAPHVAGLLARVLSRYPSLKPPVAKALLQEIALPWRAEHRAPNQ